MNSKLSGKISSENAVWVAGAVGIFTWDVGENIVWGDAVTAYLFGVDAEEAQAGLPLQSYLTRLHPDDAPRVAKAIHEAITTGEPYQEEYRLFRQDGKIIWVLAVGHCFRNRLEVPTIYSGVIYDITSQKTTRTDGVRYYCQAALDVAKLIGNHRLVSLLQDAVTESREQDARDRLSSRKVH